MIGHVQFILKDRVQTTYEQSTHVVSGEYLINI